MTRWFFSLAALLALATTAHASLHTFTPGATRGNPLTLIGSGDFELSDTPTGVFFNAIQPFTVEVTGTVGPVQYELTRGQILPDQVILQFNHPTYNRLFMQWDVAGIPAAPPAGFPASWIDDDGEVEWVAEGLFAPLQPSATLAGYINADVAAVPEPSAFAFGGLAVGLVGLGRFLRRRKVDE